MIAFWNILSIIISYVKPLLPELGKGRSGTLLGDNFSHDDPCSLLSVSLNNLVRFLGVGGTVIWLLSCLHLYPVTTGLNLISLLALLCKNFILAYYPKSIKGNRIDTCSNIMTRCICKARAVTLKAIVWSYVPF